MNKTALVTGGSRGIGAATCRALADDGWTVWVHYHTSKAEAQALAGELDSHTICADVRNREQVEDMFHATGPVGLLVNNAGLAHTGLFSETDTPTWRDLFAVNVDGVFHCTQCASPAMIRAKQGVILNISSIWGIVGASCEVGYSASKAAVIGLTKALAQELAPSGVRVNCIAPGAIDTNMLNNLRAEDLALLRAQIPLGRIGTAEDVAHLAVFLASDKAGYITGQVISPNGGLV